MKGSEGRKPKQYSAGIQQGKAPPVYKGHGKIGANADKTFVSPAELGTTPIKGKEGGLKWGFPKPPAPRDWEKKYIGTSINRNTKGGGKHTGPNGVAVPAEDVGWRGKPQYKPFPGVPGASTPARKD